MSDLNECFTIAIISIFVMYLIYRYLPTLRHDILSKHNVKSYDPRISNDAVSVFYDIATDFYEWGWSTSFHFARIYHGETFTESQTRHQHTLAMYADIRKGMRCLDLGVGIAGPLCNIAKFTNASITGITICQSQIKKSIFNIKKAGLMNTCRVLYADYHTLEPFNDATIDRSYDVESSLHATDLSQYFQSISRVLKPGGRHAGYAYIWNDDFDPSNNPHQMKVLNDYLIGNGCSQWFQINDYEKAILQAGLILEYHENLAPRSPIPWYTPLLPNYRTLIGFAATPLGIQCTSVLTYMCEKMGVLPQNAYNAHQLIVRGGNAILEAGQKDWLTPMHLYVIRKPI